MAKRTWMAAAVCLSVGMLMVGCGKEEKPSAAAGAKVSEAEQPPAPAAKTPEPAAEPSKPVTAAKTETPPAAAPKAAAPKPAPKAAPKAAAKPAATHPLANAKVGQWAMYETMGGAKTKQIVTKVTPDAVTMMNEVYVGGQDKPVNSSETRIPLTGQAVTGASPAEAPKADMKDLGKQTVEVAGKKLTCKVMQTTAHGVVVKTWTCPDVPIHGLVKTVMVRDGKENVTMKLLDFGQK